MRNEYELDIRVRPSVGGTGHHIFVEGVRVGLGARPMTEEQAWTWVANTWRVYPGDTLREVQDHLDTKAKKMQRILSDADPRERELLVARLLQEVVDIANGGLRVALLSRAR